MSKRKFSKPPMTQDELEKKAEAFISLSDGNINKERKPAVPTGGIKKQKTRPIYIRAPESLWQDIQLIMSLTGLTMNAICLELLRPEVKRKLKEIQAE